MKGLKLAITSDHAGFELKKGLLSYLVASGRPTEDLGTYDPTPVDYPRIAEALGLLVRSGRVDRGILICGSGIGASIAANKVPGIRAAICHDSYSARQGVEHDQMNILVLGARVIGLSLAQDLVDRFVAAEFAVNVERYTRRVEEIAEIERRYCKVTALEERLKRGA